MRFTFAALALATAVLAQADATIDTIPSWFGTQSGGYDMVAQRFYLPNSTDLFLNDYSFELKNAASLTFSVVPWNYAPAGPALFSRTFTADAGLVTVSGIGAMLTPGTQYAAVVDFNGDSGNGIGIESFNTAYPQGSAAFHSAQYGVWLYQTYNYSTAFKADFAPVPTPEPASVAALGLGALAMLRRRKRA